MNLFDHDLGVISLFNFDVVEFQYFPSKLNFGSIGYFNVMVKEMSGLLKKYVREKECKSWLWDLALFMFLPSFLA